MIELIAQNAFLLVPGAIPRSVEPKGIIRSLRGREVTCAVVYANDLQGNVFPDEITMAQYLRNMERDGTKLTPVAFAQITTRTSPLYFSEGRK